MVKGQYSEHMETVGIPGTLDGNPGKKISNWVILIKQRF